MKMVMRWGWLVLVSLLVAPGTGAVAAVASTLATTAGPGAEQSSVYLPLISQGYPLLNEAVSAFEPAASLGVSAQAFDATPDPEGNLIYFTATSAQGPGLFRVPATGGEVVTLTVGMPLTLPSGLAINASGETLFVADTAAEIEHTEAMLLSTAAVRNSHSEGAIFRLPTSGGAAASNSGATLVTGTEHTRPRGLAVVQENGVEMLYFTGNDPIDDQPAVMKVAAAGGPLTFLAKGAPLVAPVGVTVAADGVVYVTDQAAAGDGLGSVFRIREGTVETLATRIRTGDPAGVALTLDESLLLVSALETDRNSSIVLVIDLAEGRQGIINQVIGANIGSGGLHRAQHRNLLAWCGVTSGGGGVVYRVELN
jgi:sugar lactone lactonase YvrE